VDDTQPEDVKDKSVTAGEPIKLRGIITSLVDRLDDEFYKSLQNIDPYTAEYVERLKDELELYALLVRTQHFAESTGLVRDGIDLLVMRRVEHLYYKPDLVVEKLEAFAHIKYPKLPKETVSALSLVVSLCKSLYKSRIERVQTHAMLCHIHHLAIHDDYPHSRDLMLMSHLQETIMQHDVQTQILFNHTMVQIGFCAFRCGLFKEAHICLQEMASSGKAKELLAQGIVSQRNVEKTFEQEKLEKQRQLPFHMHVNLELLECIYLTCALFLEIPNIAQFAHDSRRKVISKAFRRMFDYYERQVFTGPPENVRDHIMAAAKCMIGGNWEECSGFINAIKTWDLLPNTEQIKEKLQEYTI
jgi:translation initiation factor 3 subunit C